MNLFIVLLAILYMVFISIFSFWIGSQRDKELPPLKMKLPKIKKPDVKIFSGEEINNNVAWQEKVKQQEEHDRLEK